MHVLDQTILGIGILLLLAMLVVIKRIATGSIFDKPQGGPLVQIVNVFNLFFLLIVNPFAGILLVAGRSETIDATRAIAEESPAVAAAEIIGLVSYVVGFILMGWALITLGRNYQLGGNAPRAGDLLVTRGPYKLLRHPMYAAALAISFGLAFISQSWVFFSVFCVYLLLILPLISLEEHRLRDAYGDPYVEYQRTTKRLMPFVY